MSDTCLQTSLSAAVPLWILEKQKQSWAEISQRIPYCLEIIAHHADDALFKSKEKGKTAAAFNAIAEATDDDEKINAPVAHKDRALRS